MSARARCESRAVRRFGGGPQTVRRWNPRERPFGHRHQFDLQRSCVRESRPDFPLQVPISLSISIAEALCLIAEALQAAFFRNAPLWTGILERDAPIQTQRLSAADADNSILLGAFLSVYMKQLRTELTPSPLADFVASLPYDVRVDFQPEPYVSEPSPQHEESPLTNLLNMVGTVLAGRPPSPLLPSPLFASRMTANIFGSGIVTALFSDDARQVEEAAKFISTYMHAMNRCGVPSPLTALALLARELCLAEDSSSPEDDFELAAMVLRRNPKPADLKLDLTYAPVLMTGLVTKVDADVAPSMSPSIVVEFLATALRLQDRGVDDFCRRRAGLLRGKIGAKLATLSEKIVFAMAAANCMDRLPGLLRIVCQTPDDDLRLMSMLALFCAEHHDLIALMKQMVSMMAKVEDAVRSSLKILKKPNGLNHEHLPIDFLIKMMQEAKPQPNQVTWPEHW